MTEVILVTENDEQIGAMEKLEAHKKGLLHRAFSVFIFNKKGEMLLHKRAAAKYHNGGLWTNACCSHPMPGEVIIDAAKRRLYEEMGFTVSVSHAFSFTYKATFDNGLTEYEFDHVFAGIHDGEIKFNTSEVSDYCYKSIEDIESSLITHPQNYTEWFKLALPGIKAYYLENICSTQAS